MAYIGAQPNKQLTKTTSQSFNGTGSATAFTLNRAVNTGEELEVFVDNVQQEPGVGKSYTATGTTLTFDEAPPSGTGNVYVIYRGQAEVTTRLEAPDLSITTAKLAADAVTTAKITDANITTAKITDANITTAKIADDAVTAAKISTVDYSSFRNPIAFSVKNTDTGAYISTSPVPYNAEDFDLGGNFNHSSGYNFTCPVNGIYSFTFNFGICRIDAANGYIYPYLTVNGSSKGYQYLQTPSSGHYSSISGTYMLSLSANDVVDVKVTVGNALYYNNRATFTGYLVAAT